MQRIGLTGGIGSGKSTVANMLVETGATLIDTDAISRALTQAGGAAMPAIVDAFGASMMAADGSLNRGTMRTLVFSEPGAKRVLEAILHPLIGSEAERQAARAQSGPLVFDVPLLVESGRWRQKVDRVLVVDTSPDTQVQRVVARSGWSVDTVRAVIATQSPRALRLRAADAVICNEGRTFAELAIDVQALRRRWA